MKDPKFGYHWIWILPVNWAYESLMLVKRIFAKLRMRWILFRNPKIKRIRDLVDK
jgi:hypothetical protein